MARTTHRSSKGTKLYAVRDKKGQFRDIQTFRRAHGQDVKRHSQAEAAADAMAAAARKPARKAVRKTAKAAVKKALAKKAAPKKAARKTKAAKKK